MPLTKVRSARPFIVLKSVSSASKQAYGRVPGFALRGHLLAGSPEPPKLLPMNQKHPAEKFWLLGAAAKIGSAVSHVWFWF